MKLDDFLPEDAGHCMRSIDTYWYDDILDFLAQYKLLKMGIVGSLEIYSRIPAGTHPEVVFRTVMNSLDRVLVLLDPKVWELFPHYFHLITDECIIWDRIHNINERLIRAYGKLWPSHQIGWWYSIACRVEKYTRFKDIDKTLHKSSGALQVVRDATSSLAAMGIN